MYNNFKHFSDGGHKESSISGKWAIAVQITPLVSINLGTPLTKKQGKPLALSLWDLTVQILLR